MILFLKKLRRICFAPQCSDVIVHVLNIRFIHGTPLQRITLLLGCLGFGAEMHAHVDVPQSRAVHVGEGFGDTRFLSSDEQTNAQVHVIAKRESTEINAFLGDSVLRQPSSVELGCVHTIARFFC
jgi:hypothetical protein